MIRDRGKAAIKRRLLWGMHSALQVSGLASAYASSHKLAGATILMYHSVASGSDADWIDPDNHMDPRVFHRQMEFVSRRRNAVSMDDLVAALQAGRALPAGSVAVTIDDGYRDTLTIAAPILAKFNIPAVLYLPTGYIAREENQWVDQLYSIFAARTNDRLRAPWKGEHLHLGAPRARDAAYRAIADRLLVASIEERRSLLARVMEELRPSAAPPRLTLSWDEVRMLRRDYPAIAVGGHTRDHVDLSSITREAAEIEISACSQDLRNNLGEFPKHFSFPYNRTPGNLDEALEKNGYVSGAATGPFPKVKPGLSRYSLPRIEAPSSLARLGFYTSGSYPELSLSLAGRA